jgi:hypothetical protein
MRWSLSKNKKARVLFRLWSRKGKNRLETQLAANYAGQAEDSGSKQDQAAGLRVRGLLVQDGNVIQVPEGWILAEDELESVRAYAGVSAEEGWPSWGMLGDHMSEELSGTAGFGQNLIEFGGQVLGARTVVTCRGVILALKHVIFVSDIQSRQYGNSQRVDGGGLLRDEAHLRIDVSG